jgi:DNA-binding IscR family transcriptional regulator
VRTTAKVDYAVRAAIELARAYPTDGSRPVPLTRQAIADAQDIPSKFLEHILADLKRSRLVASVRGAEGGYWLSRPPTRSPWPTSSGPPRGRWPTCAACGPTPSTTPTTSVALQRAWIAVRANLRGVLEHVTLADLRDGKATSPGS